MSSIKDRAEKVFQNVFDLPELTIHSEMVASDVDAWDSLSHIHLIVALEKEFSIKFNVSEVVSFQNVGDLLKIIDNKTKTENK